MHSLKLPQPIVNRAKDKETEDKEIVESNGVIAVSQYALDLTCTVVEESG